MMRALLVCLLLLMSGGNAIGVVCSSTNGDGSHWVWREVGGRRCWFQGDRRLPKSELHWPSDAPVRPVSSRRQSPPQPEGTYEPREVAVPAKPYPPALSEDRLRAAGQETIVPRVVAPAEPAPSILPVKPVTTVAIRKPEPRLPDDDLHLGFYFALFGSATLLSLAVVGVVAAHKLRGMGMAVS